MNKTLYLIPILVAISSLTIGLTNSWFHCEIMSQSPSIIGPFDPYPLDNPTTTLTYAVDKPEYQENLILTDVKGNTLYTKEISAHSYDVEKKRVSFDITLPLHAYFGQNGVIVKIFINDRNGQSCFESERILKPKVYNEIISTQYRNEDFSITDTAISYINESNGNERFSFKETPTKIFSDDKNILDIKSISFKYFFGKKFTFDSAFLLIDDILDLFPFLNIVDGYKAIPLKLATNKVGTTVNFVMKDKYYVDPYSLEISPLRKSGFTETTDFYMPLGKKDQLKDYSMKIVINEAGYNHTKVTIPLTYINEILHFDNCLTNDYCVVGGIRK